jgi:hypothetical protein
MVSSGYAAVIAVDGQASAKTRSAKSAKITLFP